MANGLPNRLGLALRAAGLIFLIGTSNAWGGSSVSIPKPNEKLLPPPSPPSLARSVVNMEVSLSAEELALLVDQTFPPVVAREDGWNDAALLPGRDDLRFLYRLHRGGFRYQMRQDRLELTFNDIRYRIWARRPGTERVEEGSCGHGDDPPKRIQVVAHTAVSWSDAWRLNPQTSFDPPAFVDDCRLQPLNVDATPMLQSLVQSRLSVLAEKIDRKIDEHNAGKQRAAVIWKKLQEPVELMSNRWLTLNPVDARVGPIDSDGGLLIKTSVNLIMEPKILDRKPPSQDRPLPSLEMAPATMGGSRLLYPVFVDYAKINGRLERMLVGQNIDTPLGEPITITGVELYGSGSKLIVAIKVKGGVNGTLYSTGVPVFDEPSRSIKFRDLDFTMDTKNMLVRGAERFWRDTLLEKMESEIFVDLAEPLMLMQTRLNEALTRELAPGARLEGRFTKLLPAGIYPVTGGVEVQMIAQGTVRLVLQ
ncbi:MAG: DUF4403 family protein [Nitrospira sp.]|nr:DUF4403 family protein [Nitrospira sp.]